MTGISLLAYMDGIAKNTPTLGSVVMAAASAAGCGVYKVYTHKNYIKMVSGRKCCSFA